MLSCFAEHFQLTQSDPFSSEGQGRDEQLGVSCLTLCAKQIQSRIKSIVPLYDLSLVFLREKHGFYLGN